MKVLVMAGHSANGYRGSGAVGILNESNENRRLGKQVVQYLKDMGVDAVYLEHNKPSTSNYLGEQVAKANALGKFDVMVQIHFNSGVSSAKGTETYYISNSGKTFANRVNAKLSTLFKNRGIKTANYYWLKNTKYSAILIETCFVSNAEDARIYNNNFNKVAQLIAEGLANKKYVATTPTTPTTPPVSNTSSFKVKIICDELNIRKGVGTSYPVVGVVKKDEVFTITETKDGWGRLKSGVGWISLNSKYVKKV